MALVEFVGLRNAQGRFARAAEHGVVARAVEQAALLSRELEDRYRSSAPRRTGAFAESFHAEVAPIEHGFEIAVNTSQAQLAKWIREGTAPHEIRARNVGTLHFTIEGADVFARRVQHPGTKPNPWEEKFRVEVEEVVKEMGNRVASRVAVDLSGHA